MKELLFMGVLALAGGCQLTGGHHGSKELAGRYPTAIHDVGVEFNNTIPLTEKYQHPLVAKVKLATKRFEGESKAKVFVDVRFEVLYKNGASQFCPLRYSWAKTTRVVLLEGEGSCEDQGDVPSLSGGPMAENKDNKGTKAPPAAPADGKVHEASAADKQNAREAAEVYFLDSVPEAEVAHVEYVANRKGYGEVEVTFHKSEGGDVLTCKNLVGYDFATEKVFPIEIGECGVK